jgi:hypothetical protein
MKLWLWLWLWHDVHDSKDSMFLSIRRPFKTEAGRWGAPDEIIICLDVLSAIFDVPANELRSWTTPVRKIPTGTLTDPPGDGES